METVSFEIAVKLKELGFSQDSAFKFVYLYRDVEFANGIGKTFDKCVYMLGYMAMPYLVPLGFKQEHRLPEYDNMYFAPTILDLMKQLPDYQLNFNEMPSCDELAMVWIDKQMK